MKHIRYSLWVTSLTLLVSMTAYAHSVVPVENDMRISQSTKASIDPMGNMTPGGSGTDTKAQVGDILTFVIPITLAPNGATRGAGGYITTYVPANTEVVGARLIDRNGNTVAPMLGPLMPDGFGPGGRQTEFDALGLDQGSLSQVYADTGIFYSTDPRTARDPNNASITVFNGIQIDPNPTGAAQVDGFFGFTGPPFFSHNAWNRIQSTGSEIGSGGVTDLAGSSVRVGVSTALGFALSADNPLPAGTNAVRFAVGELIVGQEPIAEISLRVTGLPLDPIMNSDIICSEVFSGDAADPQQGRDNTWRYFVPSPACVSLNLAFELSVDKSLAVNAETLTYTLEGQNLSVNQETNVVITDTFDPADVAFVAAIEGPVPAFGADTLTWPAITLGPGNALVFTNGLQPIHANSGTMVVEFGASVGLAVPPGLHTINLQMQVEDLGIGRDVENSSFAVAPLLVDIIQSDPPVLDAPVLSGATNVTGLTSEGAGTMVKVFINGNLVASVVAGTLGLFSVAVPTLFAGQHLNATAAAVGEIESVLSSPDVVVQIVGLPPPCQDGIDNDLDGDVDGTDLAYYISDPAGISLNVFSEDFGRTNCP